MKSTLLKKVLSLILLSVVLSAALTALVFNYTGRAVFSRLKAREIEPRAKYVAGLTADYIGGEISQMYYARAVGSEYRIWDASLYIFDAHGQLFVYPKQDENQTANISATRAVLAAVLSGNSIYTEGSPQSVGVVVGEPVRNKSGAVVGAVFMIKPIKEVAAALQSLTYALVIGMLSTTVIMIIPGYFGSRSITKPIHQMTGVADAMACGNFTVQAYAEGKDEVSQLGRALNTLSGALSETISDLTFERNRLRAVLFGLGEGIIAVNPAGEVTQYNPSAIRLMRGGEGARPDELSVYKQIEPEIQKVLRDGKSRSLEVACGEARLRFTMTALKQGSDAIEGAVTLVQDITESARLEQTRRDYVANVSHELRTPIASVRSLADALNDGLVKSEADKARYYGYMLKESMRLSRLIDDLLELSRLQSGSIAFSKQNISVMELVYETAERFMSSAKEREQTLLIQLPEDCPPAYTNPDRAEQVLIALLDNALKHADEGSTITISVEEKPDKLFISVANPGEISEADIPHVFERFYKVDRAHSGGGTGLGLAIAKEVMTLLAEDIQVRCESGQVIFTFTLQKAK